MSERSQGGGATAGGPMDARVAAPREHAPDPLIGRTINGRYRIDAVIARGGMGKVYRAEQAPLGRVCALKILSPRYDGEDDPEFRRRFFLEASTAAKLSHSNTVTIFDYGKAENEEIYYIAMEYIEGHTLSRVLRRAGPLPEDRVRHIAAQICRSLREAHGLGVVHRDLKPGNIMLTDKGDERDSVKVLDFGLVKDVTNNAEDHTQEGLFMGSPKYMAPEQILGEALSPRVDIYSMGILLYEMLTTKVPYDRGEAGIATLMAHVNEPLPSMHSVFPGLIVSPQMEAIVYRCLEKDPARRYGSMNELLAAIKGGSEEGWLETSGAYPKPRVPISTPDALATPFSERFSDRRPSVPPHRSMGALAGSIPAAPSSETEIVRTTPAKRQKLILAVLGGAVTAAALLTVVSHLLSNKPAPLAPTAQAHAPTMAPAANAGNANAAPGAAPAEGAKPIITGIVKEGAGSGAQRAVRIDSDPPGATVTEDAQELCASTPCDVILTGEDATKEHRLTVAKKGFKPSKPLVVDPQTESLEVKLVPTVGAAVVRPSSPPQPPRKADSPKGDKGDPALGPSAKPDPYKPDPY
ncbi:protein kinase domain-containing protein [Pendulispora albinea]|uniref:Protein kinase n=1 Tax=Pendulispora albinea TaxID=2741071 RepID=A0ABZ2LVN1_9BACT